MSKGGRAGSRVGRWALIAAALCTFASPVRAQAAPTKPTTLKYDSVNAVIAALMPAAQKENVKNIAFSAQGTELRMDADVRLSAVPGMEMMAALGFAKMTGVGPVSLASPGIVGWKIRTIEVGGVPLAESIWGPQVRKATKRNDNVVPVPVGSWVKGVEVTPIGLRLF